MYLRVSKQKRADGSQIAHLQFAESSWDPAKKRSQVRILYNFGRAEDPAVIERLRRLATSILKRVAPEEIVAQEKGSEGALRRRFDALKKANKCKCDARKTGFGRWTCNAGRAKRGYAS